MPSDPQNTTVKTSYIDRRRHLSDASHDALCGVALSPLSAQPREIPCPLISQELLQVAPSLGPEIDITPQEATDPESRLRSSLKQNGDINHWDAEIAKAASEDAAPLTVRVLLERGPNRPRILQFTLPSFLLEGADRWFCVRYLAASIYNVGVCEGVRNVVFSMPNNEQEEHRLSAAIDEELRRSFPRFSTYANWGDPISICDMSQFRYNIEKEIYPEVVPKPEYASGACMVGIDVGGTRIKVVVMNDNCCEIFFAEDVDRTRGGRHLRDEIMLQLRKAKLWVEAHLKTTRGIDAVGLTFPSPIKRLSDGSIRVVRLTNFERYWSEERGGHSDFSEDYDVLNHIVEDIKREGIPHVSVLNDADAFGMAEVYHELLKGSSSKNMGAKVVLPIGTGPGYVKTVHGTLERIPNQGGHMVIDLNERVAVDPGCETKGCYGGYVSASAIGLRAKEFGIDVSGRGDFVSTDLDHALGLFSDMASHIASLSVAVHKITGADEVVLTGGVATGNTGRRLAADTNIIIWARYPDFRDKVRVVLSRSFMDGKPERAPYDGAIGAAIYAIAESRGLRPAAEAIWKTEFALPATRVGRGTVEAFFKQTRPRIKTVSIVTTRALDTFLTDTGRHLWWLRAKRQDIILLLDDFLTVDKLIDDLRQRNPDEIVAIGAGSVIDWAKYAGYKLSRGVAAIPSAISGNGMFTEKAIFYEKCGDDRRRMSAECGPVTEVLIDLDFLTSMLDFTCEGISSLRANRAGAGDIVSIYPALRDWELAISEPTPKERVDDVIMRATAEVFRMVEDYAEEVRDVTDLGRIVLAEALAEASLLNMRFGSSRPKDGAEHLVADELDKLIDVAVARLHGEEVAIASLIMGYLYSTTYDTRALARTRRLVARLGLPLEPSAVAITKEMIVQCLQQVKLRQDKYTYFDRYGAELSRKRAEDIYELVFGSRKSQIVDFSGFDLCRYVNNSVTAMFAHIQQEVLPHLDDNKTKQFVACLSKTRKRHGRVIINAAGRIGEVAVFFQQKLRALGYAVDDLKEITPEFLISKDDLLLTFSGSGETCSVRDNLEAVTALRKKSNGYGCIFSITASPNAAAWELGEEHHTVLHIRGRTKFDTQPTETEGVIYLPLSSTYEYSTTLFLEGIVEALIGGAELDRDAVPEIVRTIIAKTPTDIKADLALWLQQNEKTTDSFIRLLAEVKNETLPCRKPISKRRIYFFGLGQNNYVIRLFARRMQNIGFEVYVPGPRDIVSAAREHDIAIFVSNSGVREQMIRKIDLAQKLKCTTVVITADANSPLAKKGHLVLPILPTPTEVHTADILTNDDPSRQQRCLKRGFEVAAMFYLEGISVALMQSLGLTAEELQHVAKEWE